MPHSIRVPAWRRLWRHAQRVLLGLLGLLVLSAALLWWGLRASLPQLDGEVAAPLAAKVSVARDALGVPAIVGHDRLDVAWTTGWLHAQDRYFQMDLLRRVAAGELAALVGNQAIDTDRQHRFHRFRARAVAALARLPAEQRSMLEKYTDGVNAGLGALGARPFEYGMLRTSPAPWTPEDSLLVVWAMYFDLQGNLEMRKLARGWLRDHCTADQLAVLLPEGTGYDVPLDVLLDAPLQTLNDTPWPAKGPDWFGRTAQAPLASLEFGAVVGSNNWALSGTRTVHGAAIVANDMHLGIRLPHIWYRAAYTFDDAAGVARRLVGVTLPGTPFLVAGSNGHVAWGFTNAYGDLLDLIELKRDPVDKLRFRTDSGWEQAHAFTEVLQVKGEAAQTMEVTETSLGPVREVDGRYYAVHWIAHDEGAVNGNLWKLELADDLDSALSVAQGAGMPAQNIVVADSQGRIGWTIAGALPMRDGTRAATFPYAAQEPLGWRQLRAPTDYPRVIDPGNGQLATANSRQLAGAEYAKIGDGGPDLGARARQIRDDLLALQSADEHAVAAIALDDRALFLAPWRVRALAVLDDAALAGHEQRVEFKRVLSEGWTGHASVDSAGYRLTRTFLFALYGELWGEYVETLNKSRSKGAGVVDRSSFDAGNPRWSAVLARMLDQQPSGWLPQGRSWRSVQLDAVDRSIRELTKGPDDKYSLSLADATWGKRNTSVIAHPFSGLVPGVGAWLAAPAQAMAGDENMPRVAGPRFGQSERMVVSPGREGDGLFSMPGGQSGHPLSPYFLAGHQAWASGEWGPLLPGSPEHTLAFLPVRR